MMITNLVTRTLNDSLKIGDILFGPKKSQKANITIASTIKMIPTTLAIRAANAMMITNLATRILSGSLKIGDILFGPNKSQKANITIASTIKMILTTLAIRAANAMMITNLATRILSGSLKIGDILFGPKKSQKANITTMNTIKMILTTLAIRAANAMMITNLVTGTLNGSLNIGKSMS